MPSALTTTAAAAVRRRPSRARAAAASIAVVAAGAALVAGVAGCHVTAAREPAPRDARLLGGPAVDSNAIRRDVAYLASDALAGRATGSAGNDSAAVYVARRFESLGLAPAIAVVGADEDEDRAPCAGARIVFALHVSGTGSDRSRCHSYFQRFAVAAAARGRVADTVAARNVVAIVRGTDPLLRDEYVVVGAHYDHLGRSGVGALDPALGDTAIRNGADDDASGVAAVLELARLLAREPARRGVIFATFGAEEIGLLGSRAFVAEPPVPLGRVRAMLDFDMVGRLRDDRVIVNGAASMPDFRALLDSADAGLGLRLVLVGDGSGPSDHASFHARGVPALQFFTGLHADYHRATDDADRVNVAGEARVVTLAERVLRSLANKN